MGIFAGFIGIDRHQDPNIRDLSGARRDATALWALLSDSIVDMSATKLVDADATMAAVQELFDRTLDAAGEDDVVLLSFAGHGTSDHRLVLADSRADDIPGTTVDMAELADRFRKSRARAVFCILDCCFSGGAPARVLDEGVGLRDIGIPLDQVGGSGRILVAASNVDEPALEDPVTRHGLFTKALLDCLQEMTAPVSLVGVVDQVVGRVRADAARLGYQQTPVMFGHVEGSLTLPEIRPGAAYASAFPELTGIQVSSQFSDLGAFGVEPQVLDLWAERFPDGLNSLQLSAINDHGVLAGQSLLTVAPTSAGKTFIGELAAIKAVGQGEKAVFLLPYKALVNEKFDEFADLYGEQLGLRVARCSGDWQDQVGDILRGKYDIAFFTYETFLGLSIASPYLLNQIGLVVVDEAQFITDANRGIVVELMLTNLISVRKRGIQPQIVALSAVIGHTNAFETWLGCGLQLANERPIPLVEGVMDRSGQYERQIEPGTSEIIELLPRGAVHQRRNKASSQDVIVPLVRKLVADGEKVLIFRNKRGTTAGCAAYLANELGLPPAQETLENLPQFDRTTTSQRLEECLRGGTAFHNSDLTREERSLVENAFRDPNGPVKVLAATSTVAAGVNTPASTAIIVEAEFYDKPYTVAQYKNMAGRAGRLGYELQGKSILLAETPMQRRQLYQRYIEGTPEQIESSFDSRKPETWLIRLLAQVERVTRAQAVELVANTYGGFLANMAQPGWTDAMAGTLGELLARMEADGLVESDGEDYIALTILGNACGQAPFSLDSAMRLIELLRNIEPENLSPETLMAIVQALPEQDERYTPMGRGRSEADRPGEVSYSFSPDVSRLLQRRAREDAVYYARCKRALILNDWVTGVPIEEIENRYSPNAFVRVGHGDIRGVADATRFYLGSASRIAAIVHAGGGPGEEEVATLLQRLDLGLPGEALPLADLPLALGRGEYLALKNAGVTSAATVLTMESTQLTQLLGPIRAAEIAQIVAQTTADEPQVA